MNDERSEKEDISPEIPVWFTPAQLAVGANLMALGLAVMVNNDQQGRQIMRSLSDQHIAPIAMEATKRMAEALRGPGEVVEDDASV